MRYAARYAIFCHDYFMPVLCHCRSAFYEKRCRRDAIQRAMLADTRRCVYAQARPRAFEARADIAAFRHAADYLLVAMLLLRHVTP